MIGLPVATSSLSRALSSIGRSKEAVQQEKNCVYAQSKCGLLNGTVRQAEMSVNTFQHIIVLVLSTENISHSILLEPASLPPEDDVMDAAIAKAGGKEREDRETRRDNTLNKDPGRLKQSK